MMIPLPILTTFLAASIALTIAPGPDNLFVLTQGVSRGRKTALATAWGMCSGIIVHVTAAILGVSAILRSSDVAFTLIKYLGAGYLLYLAYKAFREKASAFEVTESLPELPFLASYKRGVLMNVLNPKVAIFFLAFLPQFLTAEAGPIWFQMILLGVVFMVQGVIIFSSLALFAGKVGSLLKRKPALSRVLAYGSGVVLVAMALRLTLQTK